MHEFNHPPETTPNKEPVIPDQGSQLQSGGAGRDLFERFAVFSRSKAVREIIITVLIAVILFVGIRGMANASEVSGESMLPNLHDGERVIVSKVAYWLDNPSRGDIVVFRKPGRDYDVIHRIVGLPGEQAEIRKGIVFINGQVLEEPYADGKGSGNSEPTRLLGEDEYLIVGDNRKVSAIDVVSKADIIGKAWISYWPVDEWGTAPNHSSYPEKQESTP